MALTCRRPPSGSGLTSPLCSRLRSPVSSLHRGDLRELPLVATVRSDHDLQVVELSCRIGGISVSIAAQRNTLGRNARNSPRCSPRHHATRTSRRANGSLLRDTNPPLAEHAMLPNLPSASPRLRPNHSPRRSLLSYRRISRRTSTAPATAISQRSATCLSCGVSRQCLMACVAIRP